MFNKVFFIYNIDNKTLTLYNKHIFFYQIVKFQHCISAKLPIINANMLEEWLRVLYNIYRTFGQPVCRFQTAQETEC